jgi:hypothetical protein
VQVIPPRDILPFALTKSTGGFVKQWNVTEPEVVEVFALGVRMALLSANDAKINRASIIFFILFILLLLEIKNIIQLTETTKTVILIPIVITKVNRFYEKISYNYL